MIDILADGGMGILFRARDHRVGGNLVLIKTVKYDTGFFGYDKQAALYHIYLMRQKFRREKNILVEMALRGLGHVPSLNDFFYDENLELSQTFPFGRFAPHENLELTGNSLEVAVALEPYMVMERIVGQSVRDIMHSVSEARLLEITCDVCRILERIHRPRTRQDGTALSFVYMDLKPDNLLLDRQGGVRLVDFGAALPVVDGQRKGQGAYTPGFAAPEIRRISHPLATIDHRVDVYSLGAVLFQGLSKGHIDPMTLAQPMEDEFPVLPLDRLRDDLHPLTCEIIERALERDPEDRYRDAQQMREALERALREV